MTFYIGQRVEHIESGKVGTVVRLSKVAPDVVYVIYSGTATCSDVLIYCDTLSYFAVNVNKLKAI